MTLLLAILGDQLSHELASLREIDRADAFVLMMEMEEETKRSTPQAEDRPILTLCGTSPKS